MPTDTPPRPPAEDFDPEQTVFFQRRKKTVNLLPLIVVCALVLGSGALIVWAVSSPGTKKNEEEISRAPADDPYAGRPVLSTDQAKLLENPVVSKPAQGSSEAALAPVAKGKPPTAATPAASARFDDSKPVRAAMPVATGDSDDNGSAPPVDANAPLNFDVDDPGNDAVRKDVLQRIDLMPNITPANKDKLYASVDHARKMGRVLTVPFDKGGTAIKSADMDRLKQQLDKPDIKNLLDDPTVVFVVLGYADQKGNDKLNADISLNRARSVMDTLRDKLGFQNVMHSVAMGGSTLFSKQEADKNRVVELWAVLP